MINLKTKDFDEAFLQKRKRKPKTARTYLNSPSSTESTRKAPKLRNPCPYTHLLFVIKRCLPKRGLLATLQSQDEEVMKLKEKTADLNSKYK